MYYDVYKIKFVIAYNVMSLDFTKNFLYWYEDCENIEKKKRESSSEHTFCFSHFANSLLKY